MARFLILNTKRLAVFLFVVLGWGFFLLAAAAIILPALGLRDEVRALRCEVITYAESRGADLEGIERCEQ